MSDIIRLLPDSVANQIAAGEVIQRPASVVKELVENAIDAGADNITIIIKDAGRTLIQVVDNGMGMSDTDARLAFERHATSKITDATDLFALHTMGFRGEALASIAAVAQVDMRTMKRDASIGTRLIINGSRVESQQPEATVPGTNMMVKNLFFNVPARRKFLKKDAVEMSNIMREFERLALVNTGVDFTLVNNDVTVQQLRRGSLKQRVCQLFGKSLESQLIPVSAEVAFVKISGFVGLPEHGRRRNQLQYFFVNGRNMRHPYFHKAVLGCYDRLIAPDVQPNYFINFEVAPETIDVNIHPTKHEIKFENEAAIWPVLVAAVRESLGKFNVVPGFDFDMAGTPEIPAFDPNARADHDVDVDRGYDPFAESVAQPPVGAGPAGRSGGAGGGGGYRGSALNSRITDWDKLYAGFSNDSSEKAPQGETYQSALNSIPAVGIDAAGPSLDLDMGVETQGVMQIDNRYIVTPSHGGLTIVDRSRAHYRVLYERFLEQASNRRFNSQSIMFPETLSLSPSQNVVLLSIVDRLPQLGFEITPLGDNKWSITGAPAEFDGINAADTLLKMIDEVTETGEDITVSLCEKLAAAMARARALNSRRPMTDGEAEQLLSDLFSLSTPNYTPDGTLVIASLSADDIARLFSR